MAKKELYFWAIIPGEPHVSQLEKLKQQISEEYRTYKALNSPPHITILPPVRIQQEKKQALQESIEELAGEQEPFDVQLYGFGHFGNKVLFINIELNDELKGFYENCREAYEAHGFKIDHEEFTPHLTLATRDISKGQFKRAWDELKGQEYRLKFPVQSFYCLHHNGKNWDIEDVMSLSGGMTTY